MSPRNGGSARQGAPDTFSITRRKPYQPATTPLQTACQLLAGAYTVAVQECDERQYEAFLNVACIRAARESARRLFLREHRRAA